MPMKKWLGVILAVLCAQAAQAEVWSLRMPDTYLLPSYAKATYISRMGERHGDSHLGMQECVLNLPFTDPRRSHVGNWWLNVQANASVMVLDACGLGLRRDTLMDFAVPVTLIHPLQRKGDRVSFTLMPRFAGDGVSSAHAWDLAMVADYTVRHSDTLSYSIGLASSPRFADYAVVPYVSFAWQATPDWLVRLRSYRLAALYKVNDRLQLGPTLGTEGGSWMVNTPAGQRVLRIRSLAAAMLAEYDFSRHGQSKRIVAASVGTTIITAADICRRNADHDREAGTHYKPGLVISAEVDFRF